MKASKKFIALTTLLTLLPAAVGLALWNRLPEQMATHWNMHGEPDGWSSKAFAVLGLPLIVAGLHLLCVYADQSGKLRIRAGVQLTNMQRATDAVNPKMARIILLICPVVSLLCAGVTYGYALGAPFDVSRIIVGFMGMIFIPVGNYLPKTRQNGTVGIKLPWTFASEDNWNKTHRFAGPLWVLGGVLMLLCAAIGAGMPLVLLAILVMTLAPCAYSYALHKKAK